MATFHVYFLPFASFLGELPPQIYHIINIHTARRPPPPNVIRTHRCLVDLSKIKALNDPSALLAAPVEQQVANAVWTRVSLFFLPPNTFSGGWRPPGDKTQVSR